MKGVALDEVTGDRRNAKAEADILCDHIAGALAAPLPAEVVEKAKHHIVDTFAAMLSGADLPVGRIALSYAETQGGAPQVGVVGTTMLTSASLAAQTNAMLAHADETDDSHPESIGHPGCVIVPAAMAAAELAGASGDQFMKAVVLGYDVYARLNMTLGARHVYDAGRGPYSLGGTWGAAATAGALLGIPRDRLPFLLSNTAQQTAGIATWMRDTDHIEKAFHFGGMPARNGVSAATMVAHGFTGVTDVWSGRGNFLDAFSAEADPGVMVHELGQRFEIMRTNIKKWCVGSPIQSALDSLEYLMKETAITPENVERVDVHLPPQMIHVVCDRGMGDISCPFCVALMIVDGAFTFADSHSHIRMSDPAVLALKERVALHGSEELRDAVPIRQSIVEVTLTDGRTLSRRTRAVRGVFENPLTRDEVVAKAEPLIRPSLGEAGAAELIRDLLAIEDVEDIRSLRRFVSHSKSTNCNQE